MNQKNFITALQKAHDECVEISRRKNNDYAQENDAFANFRFGEQQGLDPAIGILHRMGDKMARAISLIATEKEAMVLDERVGDTLSDLSNYALILKVYLEAQSHEKPLKSQK